MIKRIIVVLTVILSIYSIMLGSAQPQGLLPLMDQYYNNTNKLADLNQNKIRLENSIADLDSSLIKSKDKIKNINNNIEIFKSETTALEKNIQENQNKKNETERNIHLINVLNNKESIFLLGTLIGMIVGLWIVSSALVLLWRK